MKIIPLAVYLFIVSCSAYRVQAVRHTESERLYADRVIGIGYFEDRNPGRELDLSSRFREALYFSLLEKGFRSIEIHEMDSILKKSSFPRDRLLTGHEIFKLSGSFPGRIFIQGTIDTQESGNLLDEKYSLILNCFIYDVSTGKNTGSVRIAALNLKSPETSTVEKTALKLSRKLKRKYLTN